MYFRYFVCILGLSAMLVGCGAGSHLPEADAVNCSGRGMELALQAFNEDGTEADRQKFIDACNALTD